MKLIVGLGNVGSQYARTRHNIGFMVADRLAEDLGAPWKTDTKLRADVAKTELAGEKLILAKPGTMMNLSGESVQRLMQFYKLTGNDVWVIYDDVDVDFGRLRLRFGGSSGQQGIRSIMSHVGEGFWRVRLGISRNDRTKEPSEVYVLRPFNDEEREHLPAIIEQAARTVRQQVTQDLPEQSTFNLHTH